MAHVICQRVHCLDGRHLNQVFDIDHFHSLFHVMSIDLPSVTVWPMILWYAGARENNYDVNISLIGLSAHFTYICTYHSQVITLNDEWLSRPALIALKTPHCLFSFYSFAPEWNSLVYRQSDGSSGKGCRFKGSILHIKRSWMAGTLVFATESISLKAVW